MKKLEEIQRRKVISAYGGSGSIIETLENGSLLIDDYDRWPCYRNIQKYQITLNLKSTHIIYKNKKTK